MLSDRLSAQLVLEEVEENPFLKDFYRDRARYAFQTQMHFLFSRYQQQRSLRQTDLFSDKLVADYLFQKDRIFASLNLVDKELALYERLVGWLELDVVKPDIVVYLQAGAAHGAGGAGAQAQGRADHGGARVRLSHRTLRRPGGGGDPPRRRLGRHRRAGLREHAAGDDGGHAAPHARRDAREADRARG